MKRKTARPKKPLKKKILFWQRGEIAIYLLLGIIILGAFLIVSGGPAFNLSKVDTTPAGEPIQETPDATRNDLQLKTIRFQACGATTAVDFLVDTSGSMNDNGKIQAVKGALTSFASNLTDKSVVGIRRFSADPNDCNLPITSRLLPIGFYGTNKTAFSQAVGGMCASGGTNTASAFAAELTDLTQAVTNPAYKDTPLNLVFISDGIPEGQSFGGGNCQQYVNDRFPVCSLYAPSQQCRCFDSSQDPTANPSIAQQIRALKNINGKPVRVFSILVFNQSTDGPFKSNLDNMMKTIASSPSDYYQTSDPAAIKGIYNQIANKICDANGTTITPAP